MNKPQSQYLPYLMVALAAILWGTIGVYVDVLNREGFSSLQIVALRVVSATLLLSVYLIFKNRKLFRVRLSDLHYFLGTGVVSISFFNWSYFTAIEETSLSVAVILLYTGPAFVVIMSRIFFKEPVTQRKSIALLLTLAGAVLVVELLPFTGNITRYGIITGLGAGFGYALYTVFSKVALRKYEPLTIIFHTFLMASVFMVPLSGITGQESLNRIFTPAVFLAVSGLGLLPTVLAYLLYTEGLKRIEAGKASITAMMEPVAATLIGVFLFEEYLSGYQLAGIFLVLISVLMIQVRYKKKAVR